MASTRQLKTRIRSVKNTSQITKAMELVAASRMRKAQESSKITQPYSHAAREILSYLFDQGVNEKHPLYTDREVKNRLMILITSNRGLAGAYNVNVLKQFTSLLKSDKEAGINSQVIVIGRKGAQFVSRLKDIETAGIYELSASPLAKELKPVVTTMIEKFESGEVDSVDVIFTEYINSLTQESVTQQLLPAGFNKVKVSEDITKAEFEPSTTEVLEGATTRLVEAQLYQALLDAIASEESMRMVAMKNATDNAKDIVDDLTLEMNKVRQAAITQELAEISIGAEAVK